MTIWTFVQTHFWVHLEPIVPSLPYTQDSTELPLANAPTPSLDTDFLMAEKTRATNEKAITIGKARLNAWE